MFVEQKDVNDFSQWASANLPADRQEQIGAIFEGLANGLCTLDLVALDRRAKGQSMLVPDEAQACFDAAARLREHHKQSSV